MSMLYLDPGRAPLPPADLMLRVVQSFDAGDIGAAREGFDLGGLNNLRLFERAIAAVSRWRFGGDVWLSDEHAAAPRSLEDFDRLLDFGCGCGRFLRHLGPLADRVEIHGTDIDAEMIDWLRSNIQFGRYEVAPSDPPLPYPDEYFDLLISHSVFTHLDDRRQDQWLKELQRITRPGALLLLTVQGQSTWIRTRQAYEQAGGDVERWQAELETRGILFIADDAFVGSTHPEFYHSTIHAPWYVLEHWAEFFDVDAYLPDGAWAQDLVVLRRRDDGESPVAPPIGRRAVPPLTEVSHAPLPASSRRSPVVSRLIHQLESRTAAGGRMSRRATGPSQNEPGEFDRQALLREISMLRAGLYEQGKRMSVLAAQLREEIDAVRNAQGARSGAAPKPE